ncbi:hypothetical protein RHMOL_Rhmol06G0197700 [Rhododendron molle]|uniref:Uncharacterized protein n=1 Tax=Rhododendron molle TaxID=49168 RepID=A0ACC0NEF7_RHOML|nr:hypothetical protein RHMOL_Rhmol06G0197700 [Rhododendron molle]
MVESRLWTTGSGHFRSGYLRYLKRIIDSDFPDAAIEEWHIEAKVTKQAREVRDVQFSLFDNWRVCFIPPPEEPEE